MATLEVWKDIPDYEGRYKASTRGRIKSINRTTVRKNGSPCSTKEKILTPSLDVAGYQVLNLYKNGIRKSHKVHRLVMSAFYGKSTLPVDHIDEITTNNEIYNLRYISHRDNTSRSTKRRLKKTSKYVGVYWKKSHKKWQASIVVDGQLYFLGNFSKEEDASAAYKEALNNWLINLKKPKDEK